MSKKYRYPGIYSFAETDRDIFFGRQKEIHHLCEMVTLEKLVVLYGKSGLGKTSIINAGVMPQIRYHPEKYTLWGRGGAASRTSIIFPPIRFYSLTQNADSPVDAVVKKIEVTSDKPLHRFLQNTTSCSIWTALKHCEWSSNKSEGYVLILDQFEELFSFPEDQINRFKAEFANLLGNTIPDEILEKIKREIKDHHSKDDDEFFQFLEEPLPLKIIIAIRSDRLNYINRFRDVIPYILQKSFELNALSPEQAVEAITAPANAQPESDFITPCFTYAKDALKQIIEILMVERKEDFQFAERKVDSVALQIICSHIERNIISPKTSPRALTKEEIVVSANDIGDRKDIFRSYITDSLIRLDLNDNDRAAVENLFKNHLIYDRRIRVPVFEEKIIKEVKVSPDLLHELEDARLIHLEISSSGLHMYELSHDTLIDAVNDLPFSALGAAITDPELARLNEQILKEPTNYYYYQSRGFYYFNRQLFQEAIQDFSSSLQAKPDDSYSYNVRGRCYYELKKYAEAIADFKSAGKIQPWDTYILNDLGRAYTETNQYEEAKEIFTKIVSLDSLADYAYNNLGVVLDRQQKFEDAIEQYNLALKANPDYLQALVNRANLYFQINRYEDARNDFLELVVKYPTGTSYWNELGRCHLQLNEMDEAKKSFEKIIATNSRDASALNNLGVVYERLSDSNNAIKYYSDAILVDPTHTLSLGNRANLLFKMGRYDEALEDYLTLSKLTPGNLGVINELGRSYLNLGKLYEAKQEFENILKIDKNYITAYNNLGVVYEQLKLMPDAIEQYTKAIEVDPNYISSIRNRGDVYFELKKYSDAISDYEKLLSLQPDDLSAMNQLGRCYLGLDQDAKAEKNFTEILERKKDYVYAQHNLGVTLEKQKKLDEALKSYADAISIDSSYTPSISNRGDIYFERQEYSLALDDFKHVLQLDPDNEYAMQRAALSYQYTRKFEKAINIFNDLLKRSKNKNATVAWNLGSAYNDWGYPEKGLPSLELALELEPDNLDTIYEMARSYHDLKRYEEARPFAEKYLEKNPDDQFALNMMAVIDCNTGHYENALRYINKVIEISPNYATGYINRAEILRRQKKSEAALFDLDKAESLDAQDGYSYGIKAIIYSTLGKEDLFFSYLEKSLDVTGPYPLHNEAYSEPEFRSYLSNERFQRLIAKSRKLKEKQ